MSLVDRGTYLRNYVMGVLAGFSGKELNSDTLPLLASDITQAVLEGDHLWSQEKCCEEICDIRSNIGQDIPQ